MSAAIIREGYFLLYSVVTGFCFAYIYDNLRLLRRLFSHRSWLVDAEDILYWTFCFFASFYLLYYENDGVIRFFAVLGAAVGMFLYVRTVGRLYVKALYRLIMILLTPYRFLKLQLTRVRKHFTIKTRAFFTKMHRRGEKTDAAKNKDKSRKEKTCVPAKKK